MESWVCQIVADAKKKAGSRVKLARILGVSHSTVGSWEDGGDPGVSHIIKLVAYLGGDIRRSLAGVYPIGRSERPPPYVLDGKPRGERDMFEVVVDDIPASYSDLAMLTREQLIRMAGELRDKLAEAEKALAKIKKALGLGEDV